MQSIYIHYIWLDMTSARAKNTSYLISTKLLLKDSAFKILLQINDCWAIKIIKMAR